jgi:hypothetical protein
MVPAAASLPATTRKGAMTDRNLHRTDHPPELGPRGQTPPHAGMADDNPGRSAPGRPRPPRRTGPQSRPSFPLGPQRMALQSPGNAMSWPGHHPAAERARGPRSFVLQQPELLTLTETAFGGTARLTRSGVSGSDAGRYRPIESPRRRPCVVSAQIAGGAAGERCADGGNVMPAPIAHLGCRESAGEVRSHAPETSSDS